MCERQRRERNFGMFSGKPHFDAFYHQNMGATVVPLTKQMEANSKRWGPLAPWPPFISPQTSTRVLNVYYTCRLVSVIRVIHVWVKRVLYVVSAHLKHVYYTCHMKRLKVVRITCYTRVLYLCWSFIKTRVSETWHTCVHNMMHPWHFILPWEGLERTIFCLAVGRSTDWATWAWPCNHHLRCAYN